MKNLDNSLELIYSVIESLIEISNDNSILDKKDELIKSIEKLEDTRRLLYDTKNDFQKIVS